MSDDTLNGTAERPAESGTGETARAMGVPIATPTRQIRELTRLGVRLQHVTSRRTGLSPADLSAISILVREVVGPADLARQLDVSTAAATGIVDRLEARGHVERHPIPDDRRRTALHITEAGRAAHTRHLRSMVEGLDGLDKQFTPEEKAVVERYLDGAIEVITAAVEREPGGTDPVDI